MFFMGLDIVTEFKLSICVEFHGMIEDDFSRTLCAGDTSIDRKHIAPKYVGVYHFHNEDGGNELEWCHFLCSMNTLLDCANVSLNLGDVLVA